MGSKLYLFLVSKLKYLIIGLKFIIILKNEDSRDCSKDNAALAVALRKVLIEMGVPKTGTAYEDKELDAMFEAYQSPRSIYYVVENQAQLFGGA